jgi:hypothetical protein
MILTASRTSALPYRNSPERAQNHKDIGLDPTACGDFYPGTRLEPPPLQRVFEEGAIKDGSKGMIAGFGPGILAEACVGTWITVSPGEFDYASFDRLSTVATT